MYSSPLVIFREIRGNFPCLDDMIRMNEAAGRNIDLEDLKYLREIKKRNPTN